VSRAFSSGAPAINVDGMLAGVVGAEAFAAAFLSSSAPPHAAAVAALGASDAALHKVRWRNRATAWFFFTSPTWFRHLVHRLAPKAVIGVFTEDFANLGLPEHSETPPG
jgi:hypothetical protein